MEGTVLRVVGGLGLGRRCRAGLVVRRQQSSGLQSVSAQTAGRCEAGNGIPTGEAGAGKRGTSASRAAPWS